MLKNILNKRNDSCDINYFFVIGFFLLLLPCFLKRLQEVGDFTTKRGTLIPDPIELGRGWGSSPPDRQYLRFKPHVRNILLPPEAFVLEMDYIHTSGYVPALPLLVSLCILLLWPSYYPAPSYIHIKLSRT